MKATRDPNITTPVAFMLMLTIWAAQLGDFISTKLGMQNGLSEANGAMGYVIKNYGLDGFAILKVATATFLSWIFWKRPIMTLVIVLMYIGVIVNNTIAIAAKG